ncbi:MAG: hypothetical protein J1F25_07810 [Prevotellaceae bacterium]|nr:hypothetical protein [Prevotellaceae bacterium]
MGIKYTRRKDDDERKNTADPWHVFGMGFGIPISTKDEPMVSLTGGLSDVEVATYLDGNASLELQMRVLDTAAHVPSLAALLQRAEEVDEDVERMVADGQVCNLPLAAMAALSETEANVCDVRCEEFVLVRRGMAVSTAELHEEARQKGWLQEGGTRIGDVGNLLESKGLAVTREFNYTLADVERFLAEGKDVIAVVDGGELVGDRELERLEDRFIGEIPDHAVVVTAVDLAGDRVEVFDPQSGSGCDAYPVEQFVDAWADSCFYLVVAE